MSLRSIIAIAASLASANAHMIMQSPVPFSVDKVDSGPITAAQFPCKSNLGFTVSKMNSMAVGEKQTLSFKGTAVHGGGSCQLSVTTDTEPSANSVFKVIKTMEGGCPGVEGADTFDFELPASIPNGKATFAWTWFAKLSGGPEMYMNCAPIEVTGGASDKSGFDALPDMLVANIATSSCKSPTSKVLKIPNPGENLVKAGSEADIMDGTGDCGASFGSSTPVQPSAPAGQASSSPQSPAVGQPSSPAGEYPAQPSAVTPPSAPSAPASNPGGAYGPGASGAPALMSTTLATVIATPAPAKPTGPAVPGTGAPHAPGTGLPAPAKPSVPAMPGTGAPLASGTGLPAPAKPTGPAVPGTGSPAAPGTGAPAQPHVPASPSVPSPPTNGGGSTSSCSTPGAIVCNGEKQFGICNNGSVVWQDVSAGTTCVNGAITKRSFNSRITRALHMRAQAAAI